VFALDSIAFWGLAFSILGHAATTIWWASKLSNKVERLEADMTKMDSDQVRMWQSLSKIEQTMSRLDERTKMMDERLLHIGKQVTK